MVEDEKWYTEGESDKLFAVFFPNGFAVDDVLAEIAPEGWSQSTLRFVFHPTVDQVHFEAVQMISVPKNRMAQTLQVEKMKAELKKIHREAIEDARHEPAPTIVPMKTSTDAFLTVGRRGNSRIEANDYKSQN